MFRITHVFAGIVNPRTLAPYEVRMDIFDLEVVHGGALGERLDLLDPGHAAERTNCVSWGEVGDRNEAAAIHPERVLDGNDDAIANALVAERQRDDRSV